MIPLTGSVEILRVDELLDVSAAQIRDKKLLTDLITDARSGKVSVPALENVLIHDNISTKNTAGSGQSYGHIDNKYPLVFPTLTTVGRDAIPAPTTSMKIYNSTTAQFEKWNGVAWVVDGLSTLQITPVTLASVSWALVGSLYEYDLDDANITASTIVDIIPENVSIDIVKAAEIYPKTVSSLGSVKIYAKNQPSGNITVTLNIYL